MVVKVSLYDRSKNQSIVLSNEEITVIGRGFFECQDKRVSKRHGEITVLDTAVKIKSCHHNPIFYKQKDQSKKIILWKDSEVVLGDSDIFSLLPDEFEWTINIEQEGDNNPSSTFRIRQTEEINANLTQLLREGCETPDLERTPSPDNLRIPENFQCNNVQDEPVSSTSRKRSIDSSGDAENTEIKKMKQIPSSTTSELEQTTTPDNLVPHPSNSSDSSSSTIPLINIKPDPDSTEVNNPQTSAEQILPQTSAIKNEPVDSSDQQPTSSSTPSDTKDVKPDLNAVKNESTDNPSCQQQSNLRPSCEFGVRCYRLTDEHRREYAHPMDNDYRRPNFPPAPINAPRCPYWDGCYRRNPEHFREMAHPSSDVYNTQRPPTIQIQIRQVIPVGNQQNRNRIRNRNDGDFDEDDAFDSDQDLFENSYDSDLDPEFEVENSQSTYDDDEEEENNLEE